MEIQTATAEESEPQNLLRKEWEQPKVSLLSFSLAENTPGPSVEADGFVS